MLNKQYFLRLGFVSLLLLGSAYAWYPNYTVMVTDFPIREDYLQPVRLSSIELTGLGSNFQSLFHHPLDDAFMNPAFLSQNSRHYLYIDAARDEFEPRYEPGGIRPAYIMEMGTQADVIMPYPFYWSPYREPVPDSASEPLLRLVYLGPLFGKSSPLHFGVSAEYYYNQTEFYRPTWYWYGLRYTDAFGAAMGEDLQDPYEMFVWRKRGRMWKPTRAFVSTECSVGRCFSDYTWESGIQFTWKRPMGLTRIGISAMTTITRMIIDLIATTNGTGFRILFSRKSAPDCCYRRKKEPS